MGNLKNQQAGKSVNHSNKPNFELANMLSELGDFERNKNKAMHKYAAYRNAARSIMDHPNKITSGKYAMKNLKGIGKQISLKIDEYIKDGKISKLEKERNDIDYSYIKELLRVTGIGPTAAKKFVEEGIHNLDDLRANENKLTHHQKIGLKYVTDFETRIPREEMCLLRDVVLKEAQEIDDKYILTVCGSFRRGGSSSNDIDILITHPTYTSETKRSPGSKKVDPKGLLEQIVNRLVEKGFVTDVLGFGQLKFAGVCQLDSDHKHRRLDLRIVHYDEYACGILYFTGSDEFNKQMRKEALKKGFTLNDYWLKKLGSNGLPVGEPLEVTCEKDVFDHLGMEYKAPEERSLK